MLRFLSLFVSVHADQNSNGLMQRRKRPAHEGFDEDRAVAVALLELSFIHLTGRGMKFQRSAFCWATVPTSPLLFYEDAAQTRGTYIFVFFKWRGTTVLFHACLYYCIVFMNNLNYDF